MNNSQRTFFSILSICQVFLLFYSELFSYLGSLSTIRCVRVLASLLSSNTFVFCVYCSGWCIVYCVVSICIAVEDGMECYVFLVDCQETTAELLLPQLLLQLLQQLQLPAALIGYGCVLENCNRLLSPFTGSLTKQKGFPYKSSLSFGTLLCCKETTMRLVGYEE